MRRTSRLVLLLGIFLAALTFVVVLFLSNGSGGTGNNGQPAGPTAPPTQLPVVVAVSDIPLGTVVTADLLTTRTIAVPSPLGVLPWPRKSTTTNVSAARKMPSSKTSRLVRRT